MQDHSTLDNPTTFTPRHPLLAGELVNNCGGCGADYCEVSGKLRRTE